jgi:hypothetical protein
MYQQRTHYRPRKRQLTRILTALRRRIETMVRDQIAAELRADFGAVRIGAPNRRQLII